MRPHLDNTNPHKDTRRQSVKRANGNDGGRVVAVEVLQNANSDGHTDGRDEGKRRGQHDLLAHGECRDGPRGLGFFGDGGIRVLRAWGVAVGFFGVDSLGVRVGVVVRGSDELLSKGGWAGLIRSMEVAVVAGAVGVAGGVGGEPERRNAGAEGDAFEHLMEHDDDEEGDEERVASDNKGEADDYVLLVVVWRGEA